MYEGQLNGSFTGAKNRDPTMSEACTVCGRSGTVLKIDKAVQNLSALT